MILFTVLVVTLLVLALATVFTLAMGGTVLAIVFGDLIVFVLLIALIVHLIRRKRKK